MSLLYEALYVTAGWRESTCLAERMAILIVMFLEASGGKRAARKNMLDHFVFRNKWQYI